MGGHWPYEAILSEHYLSIAAHCARQYAPKRDRYVPGGQMWVTDSGDAGCGGNTWASTYADVPRTLNELGEFSTVTSGVIFHNTLASSDYGFLKHGTFEPRPIITQFCCGTGSWARPAMPPARKSGKALMSTATPVRTVRTAVCIS